MIEIGQKILKMAYTSTVIIYIRKRGRKSLNVLSVELKVFLGSLGQVSFKHRLKMNHERSERIKVEKK